MKRNKKLKAVLTLISGTMAVLLAFFCIGVRISGLVYTEETIASSFLESRFTEPENTTVSEISETQADTESSAVPSDPEEEPSATQNSADETLYPVIETHIGEGAIVYSNFSMKNTTDYNVDFEQLLSEPLPFSIRDTHEAQVLIIHTHACERYLEEDTGYYPESYYPRTADNSKNVTSVGESITRSLKNEGIGVVHCSEQYDNPSYNGSYDRSLQSINRYLEKYPNIKVVLDIHRDSLGSGGEEGKIKPTFTYDGKKAAQIMIMAGYDSDSSGDFPNWKENLVFALKLQQTAENMFPGMTRPLYFGNFVYNLNVNNGSLLIEIGTDVNTLDEAMYTGELLGKALANVLQNNG